MFGDTVQKLTLLRPPVRSLVLLYWIYSFAGSLVGVFTQIFLYQKFTSITLNILAAMFLYTGIMLGFCVFGYIASLLRYNIKQGFLWSFIVVSAAILLLLHTTTVQGAYITMLLWGIGQGLFWITIHTFELTETKDHERDFYSSVLSAGNQILSLAGPALATFLIWLSGSIFHIGVFTLLFSITPVVYLFGFFCFGSINNYYPKRVLWADVQHFFIDARNRTTQIYLMGSGFSHIFGNTIPPLIIFFILGTALRVGVYDTVLAIFSALCLIAVAHYRKQDNRLRILGFATVIMVVMTIWFGYNLTFIALVIYSIIGGILDPLMSVSNHVINLQTMESIGRKESDFYATMLFRDASLWVWRLLGGCAFLLVAGFLHTEKMFLTTGLYILAASFILTYIGAHMLLKKNPIPTVSNH